MALSLATLNRCAELWASQTISPTADDFEDVAAMLGRGRRELLEAIAEATDQVQLDAELEHRGLVEETHHVVTGKDLS